MMAFYLYKMKNAKTLTRTWNYFSNNARKEQAKHMLEKAKDLIIYEINKLKIFKMNGHFEVINSESLSIKFFDTEEDCINYCLDIYPNSFFNKQKSLFDIDSNQAII
jgi:hypothetical protein